MGLKKQLNELNIAFDRGYDYDAKMQAVYNVKKEMANRNKKISFDESDIKLNTLYECLNIKIHYPDEQIYIMGFEHKLRSYNKIHILCDELPKEFFGYIKKIVDGAAVVYSKFISFDKMKEDCVKNLDMLYVIWASSYEQCGLAMQSNRVDNLLIVDEFMKCAIRKVVSESV